jgi:hypothetical protein
MATRYARTEPLQRQLAEAHRLLAKAEALAASNSIDMAMDQLIDAANLYRSIESEGANYRVPLRPLMKREFKRSAPPIESVTLPTPEMMGMPACK